MHRYVFGFSFFQSGVLDAPVFVAITDWIVLPGTESYVIELPWLQKLIYRLSSFVGKVIRERCAELDRLGPEEQKSEMPANLDGDAIGLFAKRKRLAFLDLLLAAANLDPTITHDDIQEEVDTFMFEVWKIYGILSVKLYNNWWQ